MVVIPRIAGNPLNPFDHNIVGNNKCDGLKTNGIGKSAAEPLKRNLRGRFRGHARDT